MVPTELPASSSGRGTTNPAARDDSWPEGLVALYTERRTGLVRLAYLLTSDLEVAEEVVHDAVLALRPRWDTILEPPAYLRTAVVNRCRSWLRRQCTARAYAPPRAEEVGLGADELWDALATLDDRRRTAIVLRFYEDLPDAAIAEVLGCRPATVRTLVHRGLHALRKEIEP
ncbi:MAG TPA: sigma-70 family RNA polymerase sigma factor [Iamia sp.]|jgi:RNA polymerase sigma factor (sigma-70 family)|nr:sigma-70 family RNA polymerase sigma factor [Iamia sp.]